MKSTTIKRAAASVFLALLISATPGISVAESLAGKVGDSRFAVNFPPGSTGGCQKTYKNYVAASGHSAYATTFYSRVDDLYVICGAKMNAPTQKAAEDGALRSCQAGIKKWKLTIASGGCGIAASK
jgi:hypothetical protein